VAPDSTRRTVDPAVLVREGDAAAARTVARIQAAMAHYNARLLALQRLIRTAQPKAHGAVLLHLERCGRDCLGCPHPVWVKWVNRNVQDRKAPPTWYATRIRRPGAAARARHIPPEARQAIRQARQLIEQRARLIAQLKRLNQAVRGLAQHDSALRHAIQPKDESGR